MPRRAAVTGASGFVGVNLVEQLHRTGWTVRVVEHRRRGGRGIDGIERVVADVRDLRSLETAFADVDVVFHLAARISLLSRDPEAWDVNVHGPAAVGAAALAQGVHRVVHCSSVHAFDLARSHDGLDEQSPRATTPDRPIYDRSKAAGERALQEVIDEGLDAVIVNPTGIIGPIDPGPSRMNRILRKASEGRLRLVVTGAFDWVDVRDVVAGLVAAVEHGRTGENYLLPGHRASPMYLATFAAHLTGHHGPWVAVPLPLARWVAPVGEQICRALGTDVVTPASLGPLRDDPRVDGSKAARELGHAPRPLDETVRDLVRWFESTGASPGTAPGGVDTDRARVLP